MRLSKDAVATRRASRVRRVVRSWYRSSEDVWAVVVGLFIGWCLASGVWHTALWMWRIR